MKLSGDLSNNSKDTLDLLTPVLPGIGLPMDFFAVSLAIGSTTRSRRIYAAAIGAVLWCAPDSNDGDRLDIWDIPVQDNICF